MSINKCLLYPKLGDTRNPADAIDQLCVFSHYVWEMLPLLTPVFSINFFLKFRVLRYGMQKFVQSLRTYVSK